MKTPTELRELAKLVSRTGYVSTEERAQVYDALRSYAALLESHAALVKRWRDKVRGLYLLNSVGQFEIDALGKCADELDAAIAGEGKETPGSS